MILRVMHRCFHILAHRNRSDFCDLRLRCPSRTPEIARFGRQEKAMLHCDLRLRWKVASDLRFRAAISEPKTPSFCGISGDLAQSTRKSLAIAIVRFWCAKIQGPSCRGGPKGVSSTWAKPGRFGSFFVLCFLALGGHCLQMLCLPRFGTRANTQNLPHFRAFPASIQEHSPQKCLFFMANAKLPNRPGFALLPFLSG